METRKSFNLMRSFSKHENNFHRGSFLWKISPVIFSHYQELAPFYQNWFDSSENIIHKCIPCSLSSWLADEISRGSSISNWELEEISSVSVFPDESFVIRYNSTLNALPNSRTEQYSFRISAWALNKEKFDEQRKGKIIFLTIFSLSRCKGSLCLKFIRIYSGHSALQGANFFFKLTYNMTNFKNFLESPDFIWRTTFLSF